MMFQLNYLPAPSGERGIIGGNLRGGEPKEPGIPCAPAVVVAFAWVFARTSSLLVPSVNNE